MAFPGWDLNKEKNWPKSLKKWTALDDRESDSDNEDEDDDDDDEVVEKRFKKKVVDAFNAHLISKKNCEPVLPRIERQRSLSMRGHK